MGGALSPGRGRIVVAGADGRPEVRPWWESATREFYEAVEFTDAGEPRWRCGHDHEATHDARKAFLEAGRCATDHGRRARVVRYPKARRVAKAEAASMRAQEQRLVETAPPIRKTSGLSKAHRLARSWQQHFDSWRAYLGRPMLVSDLSMPMRKAFHMDTYPDSAAITKEMIAAAARRSLREAENQMREAQNKRVTKEAFWVPPGVR